MVRTLFLTRGFLIGLAAFSTTATLIAAHASTVA